MKRKLTLDERGKLRSLILSTHASIRLIAQYSGIDQFVMYRILSGAAKIEEADINKIFDVINGLKQVNTEITWRLS